MTKMHFMGRTQLSQQRAMVVTELNNNKNETTDMTRHNYSYKKNRVDIHGDY